MILSLSKDADECRGKTWTNELHHVYYLTIAYQWWKYDRFRIFDFGREIQIFFDSYGHSLLKCIIPEHESHTNIFL